MYLIIIRNLIRQGELLGNLIVLVKCDYVLIALKLQYKAASFL